MIDESGKLLEILRPRINFGWTEEKKIRRLKSNYKPGDLVLVKVFNRRKLDPFFTLFVTQLQEKLLIETSI